MDKKERTLFRKLSEITSLIASNVNEKNFGTVCSLIEKLETDLSETFKDSKCESIPIWRSFSNMTEDEIRREFSDIQKYPDIKSIKLAVKGFLEMRKVSKVKTRETLIDHIIETYSKRQHLGELGR
ncbi:MAG: hypothetical protein NWE92_01695 [Candidatus Bathyarchaeota archaeon]|nr:hypothetical protein [Candidatus Bathyarchaeota archaeon]